MNRDDIVLLAKKVGAARLELIGAPDVWQFEIESLQHLAALVAERERETCAKLCDDYDDEDFANKADMCAEAIRARGDR